MRTCDKCGMMMAEKNFIQVRSPFFIDGYTPICANCLTKLIELDGNDWNAVDRVCRWINVPFVPAKFEEIKEQNPFNYLKVYCEFFLDEEFKGIDWGDYFKTFSELKKKGTLEDEIPLVSEARRRELWQKWGPNYDDEALNYLENLYNGLLATQNVNGALQTDQALKICKISYELDNRIRGGQDFDKILTAYDKLVKTAEFTPKNAKNINDFDSIGELIAWMEKRGWKNPYYDDVPKDIVDETMQNIQAFNQRLYVNESGIGEEINRRLEALNNARVNESDEFVEKETYDLDQYESDGYDGLFDTEEFQADLDEVNQQDKSQWDNDDRLNQKI